MDEKIQFSLNQKDINLTEDLCSESSSTSKIFNKDVYIYSWGKNKYGELGLNNAKNTFIPSPVKTLKSTIIKSVKSGGRNTIILTSDGQILVCGSNIFNLLATNVKFQNNEQYQKTFKALKYFEENDQIIKDIAVAEFHSLALNESGEVFGWGGNLFNKLGQTNGLCGLPSKIYIKRKIISIACGDYHSCALSENGVLYSWGGGGESYNKGQCGHGSKKDVEIPKKVEFFTKKGLHIIKISCGGYHTIVMDENNQLYGFGKGIFGQCGYGHTEDADSPKKITFNEKDNNKIIDIKCGGEHTVFLSNNGKVYACGHGYYGQLGLGNNKNIKSPILVQSLSNKNVIEIGAGWSHTLVLTDGGFVYSAGCGKFGELGLGENKNKYNYTWIKKLGNMNVKHIFAGGHHSWCILDDRNPLKVKFVEPEPLEKPNFRMSKRKLSGLSDNNNNLSFDEANKRRNKSSNTVGYGKNKRDLYDDNSVGKNNFRIKSFDKNEDKMNNINIFNNEELKRMIDDYNDDKNNSFNNIDNLIERFDNINNTDSKNKSIDNINNDNENEEDNYIRNNNDNNINNKKDNYNSGNNNNLFDNNKNYISNEDNNINNLINKGNKNQNYNNDYNNNENDNNNEYNSNNNNAYISNNSQKDNIKNNNNYIINENNDNFNNNNNIDNDDFNEDDYIRNNKLDNVNNKNNYLNDSNSNYNKNRNNINNDNNKSKPINNKYDNYNKNYEPYNNNNYITNSSRDYNSNRNDNKKYSNNSSKNNFQKKTGDILSKKNNEALLYLKNINQNKIQLQVVYSELNLSHRFIRFSISKTNKFYKLDFKSINNMISKYLSFDKGNVSFKLQDDREVIKEGKKAINPMMDNLLKEMRDTGLFNTENKNKITYTLAIVYDYNKNEMFRQIYEEFKENYNEKNISYFNFKLINENQILDKNEELESVISKWVIDFYEQFKELFVYYEDDIDINNYENNNEKIYKPRFLELRPKIFK